MPCYQHVSRNQHEGSYLTVRLGTSAAPQTRVLGGKANDRDLQLFAACFSCFSCTREGNEIVLSVSAGFIQLFVLWNMNFLWSLRSISFVLIDVFLIGESGFSSSEDSKLKVLLADIEKSFVRDDQDTS